MDIEDIRSICLALPATEEELKWKNLLCFMVGRKIFCSVPMDESELRINFKVTDEEFEELCQRDGFIPAPYMARNKRVRVNDINKITRKELQYFIHQSYELIKARLPKKIKQELNLDL